MAFNISRRSLSRTKDGFVALGITFAVYGVAQLVGGYGFIAVFLSAVAFRDAEREHEFHQQLHDFAEQIERLLMMVLLVCLGSIAASGPLFANVDWRILTVAVLTLVAVRPLLGWISLLGTGHSLGESVIIATFGIRGLGSIYYLAYATGQASFDKVEIVWATVFLIILASILAHGIAVTPTMRWIDRKMAHGRRQKTKLAGPD